MPASAATTMARSRLRMASMLWFGVPPSGGPARAREVGERPEGGTQNGATSVRVFDLRDKTSLVRIIEIQLSHSGATFLRGNHVGPFEQETAFVLDSNGLGVPADRIPDRFKSQRDRRTHAHAAVQAVYLEVKPDILRIEELRDGFGDDLKRHAAFLACGDSHQGFALLGIRLLLKKQRESAIALVQRARPVGDETDRQAVQRQVAVAPAVDAPRAHAVAKALGWRRFKFARAAIVATAGLYVIAFDGPFGFCGGTHELN